MKKSNAHVKVEEVIQFAITDTDDNDLIRFRWVLHTESQKQRDLSRAHAAMKRLTLAACKDVCEAVTNNMIEDCERQVAPP